MKTKPWRFTLWLWLICQLLAFSLLLPASAYADDCLRDPLNAADCMRTPGFRPAIAVIVSVGGTVATILVNVLSGTAAAAGQTAGAVVPGAAPSPTSPPPAYPPTAPLTPPPPQQQPASPPGTWQSAQEAIVAGTQSDWFGVIKNLAGPASTIAGSLSEFFTFPNSPQVVDAIRKAAQAWRSNPTKATADAYVKAVRGSADLRLNRAAGRLDVIAKAVDVVDAVGAGLKKAQERGYSGVDKALAVSAELGKKGLTWILTKNPVVGLTDAALGGATQMIWGPEGKIDIGSAIDKGADAWDRTTQEYFGYTQGAAAQDAEIQVQDQFLHLLRRIRSQVDQGTLTREQGSARMRQLRNRMFGG